LFWFTRTARWFAQCSHSPLSGLHSPSMTSDVRLYGLCRRRLAARGANTTTCPTSDNGFASRVPPPNPTKLSSCQRHEPDSTLYKRCMPPVSSCPQVHHGFLQFRHSKVRPVLPHLTSICRVHNPDHALACVPGTHEHHPRPPTKQQTIPLFLSVPCDRRLPLIQIQRSDLSANTHSDITIHADPRPPPKGIPPGRTHEGGRYQRAMALELHSSILWVS